MPMITKKKYLLLFLGVFILLFHFPQSEAFAETGYVDDCLENPENCEEPLESEPEPTEAENELLGEESNSGSLFFEIIKIFFALLLVLALIYITLYFLKKRNKLGNRINSLENIGMISVGQNKSVQLVRVADRLYVIGVGEDVTLLQEIEDEALISKILEEKEANSIDYSNGLPFASFLQKKNKGKEDKTRDFKKLFNNELNSLQKNRKNIIDRHKEDNNE